MVYGHTRVSSMLLNLTNFSFQLSVPDKSSFKSIFRCPDLPIVRSHSFLIVLPISEQWSCSNHSYSRPVWLAKECVEGRESDYINWQTGNNRLDLSVYYDVSSVREVRECVDWREQERKEPTLSAGGKGRRDSQQWMPFVRSVLINLVALTIGHIIFRHFLNLVDLSFIDVS